MTDLKRLNEFLDREFYYAMFDLFETVGAWVKPYNDPLHPTSTTPTRQTLESIRATHLEADKLCVAVQDAEVLTILVKNHGLGAATINSHVRSILLPLPINVVKRLEMDRIVDQDLIDEFKFEHQIA